MHAPRSLTVMATIAACLLMQACSESEEAGTAGAEDERLAGAEGMPPPAAEPSGGSLPRVASRPEGVDACALLNAPEVEDVLGQAVEGPDQGQGAGGGKGEGKMTSCSFESGSATPSENAAPAEILAELDSTWFVNVTVWDWPSDGEAARNYINGMRDAPMTDAPVRDVENLGDEAVWNGALHARSGHVTVSLDVRPAKDADDPGELEKERKLLEKALERL